MQRHTWKGKGVIMKKILISAAIVLVLITGFAVGQNQLKDEPDLVTARSGGVSSNYSEYSDTASDSSGKAYKSSDSKAVKSDVAYPECDALSDCGVTTEPYPDPDPTGNPLSKFIIKSGTVTITISKDSLTKKYDTLVNMVKDDGGYIERDTSSEHSSTVTVRIPADKLDGALVNLRKLGKVKRQSISSNDQAFTVQDNEARLKVLQQRKDVLSASLAKANANDTQYIQEQIFQVQTQIETLTGQQALVKDQIAMSTLTITMNEKGSKAVVDEVEKQSLIAKSWEKSSKSFLTSVGGILIVIAATFPFLIVGLILVVSVRRAIRNKKNKTEDK